MPNLVYKVNVNSPCPGDQLIEKRDPSLYTGSSGDFTYVVLAKNPSQSRWDLTVYDYSNPSGDCYPSKNFAQATPNLSDPVGTYDSVSGTSGQAFVSDYP